ncbi:MAG: AraC family transcriptional regulator [Peptococcaceae bacterium BICA1-7]|nr:MAG: AraC family transcriptional regulator [Peptococcaceae bacterium BICA1-7]HBV97212.1 AraC family transcriptional regulator [Desulfotomaculum sp.]
MARGQGSREKVKIWRLPRLGGLELMRAAYVNQSFPRHFHRRFALGVIEGGALGFSYRGERLVAHAGCINLANPGEAHTGSAASPEGWVYRMFYMDPALLRQAASEAAGRPWEQPYFRPGVIRDDHLAWLIRSLHMAMESTGGSFLEQETLFLWTLTQLLLRHGEECKVPGPPGREHLAVKRAREYIESNYSGEVSLKDLCGAACLSPFHLTRVFSRDLGIPPHVYLTQVRVDRARDLLARGLPPAEVACAAGFSDQSHLTRHFKRITGITPGQYSHSVRESRSHF